MAYLDHAQEILRDTLEAAISDAVVHALEETKLITLDKLNGKALIYYQDCSDDEEPSEYKIKTRRFNKMEVRHLEKLKNDVAEGAKRRAKERMNRRRRGGREPVIAVTDEQCIKMARSYTELLRVWRDAAKIRSTNRHRGWRSFIKLMHADLPEDLVERLDRADMIERRPSVIALTHAACVAGVPEDAYSQSILARLQRRGLKLLGQSIDRND